MSVMATITQNAPSLSLQLEEEEARGVTEGYDEYFEPPLTNVYECPICLSILRLAVQTDCGHRFCKGCIMKTLSEGRKACPVDNQPLEEKDIYPDNFARREILMSNVHCRNWKDQECPWLGRLMDLERHMQECSFQLVPCRNDCGMDVQRRNLREHMETECPKRVVECQYCKMSIPFDRMMTHNTRCTKFPVICPKFCASDAIPRDQLEDHLNNSCPNVDVACPYKAIGCDFVGKREMVAKHLESMGVKHTADLVNLVKRTSESTVDQNMQAADLRSASHEELIMRIIQMDRQINILKEKVADLTDKSNQAHTLLEAYSMNARQTYDKITDEMNAMTKKIEGHDTLLTDVQAKIWCGKFVWRINNFEGLFQEAKSGGIPAIHSLPFYTAIPGYKMCIRVNLNGVDTGTDSHISVFVHMMQGEFDSTLQWPFSGKITISIVDQGENEKVNVTETLIARPGLQAFVRPRATRNHKGYGYVQMVPHTTLRSREYVKNDVLVIDVRVDVS